MKYNHCGIPTDEVKENEAYIETSGFKFYATPFEANKYHVQWHRFPEGHGLPELSQKWLILPLPSMISTKKSRVRRSSWDPIVL